MKKRSLFLGLAALIALPSLSFAEATLKNESEFALVLTGGNSRTESNSLKHMTEYAWPSDLLRITGGYLRSEANDIENARKWSVGLRYERTLSESWSIFLGQSVEADPFAGYLQRYSSDLGAKYTFIKEKELTWFGELGYRFQRENRVAPPSLNNHMARVYTEATKAWNESVSSKLWVEYLPNFSNSSDWQLNTELSVQAMMSSVFSLKTGVLVKYDGLPVPGARNTDTVLTSALVAKY